MKIKVLYRLLLMSLLAFCIRSEAFEPAKEVWDALRYYAEALSKPIEEDRNFTGGLMRALEFWENTKRGHDYRASFNQPLRPQEPIPKGADRVSLDKRNAICDQLEKNRASVKAMIENLPDNERNRPNYVRLRRMLVALRKEANKLEGERLKLKERASNTLFDVERNMRGMMEMMTTDTLQAVPVGPPPKGIRLTWRDFPRIDGSTTAQPLSTLIACRVLGLDCMCKKSRSYNRTIAASIQAEDLEWGQRLLFPVVAKSTGDGMGLTAEHERCHLRSQAIYDPVHYLPLLERKPRTLEDSAPMQQLLGQLPECFSLLRRRLEADQEGRDAAPWEMLQHSTFRAHGILPPIIISSRLSSHLAWHSILRANGAIYPSLGQRPRKSPPPKKKG